MPTPEEVVDLFENIRQTFFPRWDRKKEWSVVIVDDLDGAQGRCEPEAKQIQLATYMEGDELTSLIIHEVAHAVARIDHGRRWLARMEKAAVDADKMDLGGIAGLLREQIKDYREGGVRYTAQMVYAEMETGVMCQPHLAFPQVVDWLRRNFGLSREQFLRRFRRSRAVYDEAQRDAEERDRCRAGWMKDAIGGVRQEPY
jgi:hypothetical protein